MPSERNWLLSEGHLGKPTELLAETTPGNGSSDDGMFIIFEVLP